MFLDLKVNKYVSDIHLGYCKKVEGGGRCFVLSVTYIPSLLLIPYTLIYPLYHNQNAHLHRCYHRRRDDLGRFRRVSDVLDK